jgi:hypothetical protein
MPVLRPLVSRQAIKSISQYASIDVPYCRECRIRTNYHS